MKVGVIGSGSIGPDLAYGFLSSVSRAGGEVVLVDISAEALAKGKARIEGYMQKGLARGKLSPKAVAGMQKAFQTSLELSALSGADYVLEAASEDLDVKRKILRDLEKVVGTDCLIGFATSGIPRKEIARDAAHPARCFVNHPFYPAWRSLPIEVVLSEDAALGERMLATLKALGKVPVATADVPCFAADDIFCNYISEAARIVEEGVATPAQVDAIVHDAIGGGGPFQVMDLTRGNLLTVKCQRLMAEAGGAWFAPPAILTEKGDAPWHDRKAPGDRRYDDELKTKVLDRILAVLFARCFYVVDEGICAPLELNWMTRTALGFAPGLLEIAEDLGAERVRALGEAYAAKVPSFPRSKSMQSGALPKARYFVRTHRDGAIGTVEIFRPEVRNALSSATIREIDSAFTELLGADDIKGVIFTSYDGALAGADITELAALPDPDACRQICLDTHPVMARIEQAKKPVVAALNGPVMGGGAEFSMACRARVVGPGLIMSQPEVNLGIIPGYGGTQRLPRLIGFERAFDLLRSGRAVGAKEACEWGWATGAPEADPRAAAKALIEAHNAGTAELRALDAGPMTIPSERPSVDIGHRSRAIDGILVDVIVRGLALPLAEGLSVEADGFGRCKATVDLDIGMKNFMQNGPRVPAQFLHE